GLVPLPGLSLEARVSPRGVLGDIRAIRRLVASERIDVIHSHHSHDHWLAWLARGRAALVRTFHNQRAVSGRWPTTALYRGTQALVAVSAPVETRCREAGLDAARVVRVDGVVDVARFMGRSGAERVRKEFGVGSGPLLGTVARLAARRGHEPLIRGFALV